MKNNFYFIRKRITLFCWLDSIFIEINSVSSTMDNVCTKSIKCSFICNIVHITLYKHSLLYNFGSQCVCTLYTYRMANGVCLCEMCIFVYFPFYAHSLYQHWPNQSNDGLVVYFLYLSIHGMFVPGCFFCFFLSSFFCVLFSSMWKVPIFSFVCTFHLVSPAAIFRCVCWVFLFLFGLFEAELRLKTNVERRQDE